MVQENSEHDTRPENLPPISWDDEQRCWMVRSHALVRECLAADGQLLSSNFSVLQREALPRRFHRRFAGVLDLLENLLTLQDDPYHAHVRSAVVPAFNRAFKASIPMISETIDRHVAKLGQNFDLIAHLTDPIAKESLAHVMDIPDEQRETTIATSVRLLRCMEFDGSKRAAAEMLDGIADGERALEQLRDLFEQQILRFDPEQPRGFVGQMLRAGSSTQKSVLSETEIAYQAITMLMAGFVTMTSLLARSITVLARDKINLKKIVSEPAQFRLTVETLLREAGPTAYVMRRAMRGFSLGDNRIEMNDLLQLRLIEANHDPAVYGMKDSDTKPKHRVEHLTFGDGLHVCPGASMAKFLLTRTIETLARHDVCVRAEPGNAPQGYDRSQAIIQYTQWPAINSTFLS